MRVASSVPSQIALSDSNANLTSIYSCIFQILQAIARKVHLAPSVDLNLWASRTEGYSGADLQAVLYNAHLETIHDSIAASADAGAGGSQTNGAVNSAVKDEEGEEKPVQFVAFGGGKEKKATTMSGAEQQALRRRVSHLRPAYAVSSLSNEVYSFSIVE